jgi:hypothetical protein
MAVIKSGNWLIKGLGTVAAKGSAIISSSPSKTLCRLPVVIEASKIWLPYKCPCTEFL